MYIYVSSLYYINQNHHYCHLLFRHIQTKQVFLFSVIYFLFSTFFGLAHEVVGMENIPNKGPALLCMYHGTLPVDVYYLLAKLQLYKKRRLKIIVDHFLFKLPGEFYLALNDYLCSSP